MKVDEILKKQRRIIVKKNRLESLAVLEESLFIAHEQNDTKKIKMIKKIIDRIKRLK